MIGSLQYAAGGTRPDIAYIVSVLACFCGKTNNKHLNASKREFRYLKGTQDLSLSYTKTGNEDLIGNWDTDYAGDRDTRRSTSGNLFLLGDGDVVQQAPDLGRLINR